MCVAGSGGGPEVACHLKLELSIFLGIESSPRIPKQFLLRERDKTNKMQNHITNKVRALKQEIALSIYCIYICTFL